MNRRKLVAANWKMNGSRALADTLLGGLREQLAGLDASVEVAIIPPAVLLADVSKQVVGTSFAVGAQNLSQWRAGAYTGEVSGDMLKDAGCQYVLVGHSERRQLFAESDEVVAAKVQQALQAGLSPILCVGETLDEREAGKAEAVVVSQVRAALESVAVADMLRVVVAYEPVWAIGTGKTATAEDAQRIHAVIRETLAGMGADANLIVLLYGGSVKPDNAAELFAQPDIDGGLIGGASLDANDFSRICQSFTD
ncbi:MAG: triose-phosphate isomerase [Marinobacter sp.]|nr:triose-phosphate isomerase [Marinobacter sp.]